MKPVLLTFGDTAGEQVITLTRPGPEGDLAADLGVSAWARPRARLLQELDELELPGRGMTAMLPDDPFDWSDLVTAAARHRALALHDAHGLLLPVLRVCPVGSVMLAPGVVHQPALRRLHLRESTFVAVEQKALTHEEARASTSFCYWTADGAMALMDMVRCGRIPAPRAEEVVIVLARSRRTRVDTSSAAAYQRLMNAVAATGARLLVADDVEALRVLGGESGTVVFIAHHERGGGVVFGEDCYAAQEVAGRLGCPRVALLRLCHGDEPTGLAVALQQAGVTWVSANRGRTLLGAALLFAARFLELANGMVPLPVLLDTLSFERLTPTVAGR